MEGFGLFQNGITDMRDPQLSYRVFKKSTGWEWRLLNSRHEVLASGATTTSAKARAKALLAAISIIDGHRDVANDPTGFIHDDQAPPIH